MPPNSVMSAVVKFQSVTGMPADSTINVLNFGWPSASEPELTYQGVATAIMNFYNSVPTGGSMAIGARIAESISRATDACTITMYRTSDLSGASGLGSPIEVFPFTLTAAQVGHSLPEEVSIVISYHGDLTNVPVSQVNPTPPPATIRPAQRRRGRLFFGPVQSSAGTEASLQFRPNQQIQDELGEAFVDLAADAAAVEAGVYLGVWSKADEDVYEVVGGYVDDAWDTQRRRGLEATERTPFVIA